MSDQTELPVLLIVEDDEGLQRQLKWAYEGYRVVSAGDRATAIEMVRLHEPAVVTLDLGLPPDPEGDEARGTRTRTSAARIVATVDINSRATCGSRSESPPRSKGRGPMADARRLPSSGYSAGAIPP